METVGMIRDGGPLTGIVAAMEEEIAPLRARLVGGRRVVFDVDVDAAQVTVGMLGGTRVALVVTGDGAGNARRGLASFLSAMPPQRIIVLGVAGGLSAGLGAGALVVGAHVVDETDGRVHAGHRDLVELAETVGRARRGVAVTALRIADSAAEKRRLFALATTRVPTEGDLSERAAVVDLESAVFAAVASDAGVPWLVLRAVSDTAAESVPALLNRSRDEGGAVRRDRVARGLLMNPRALMPLLALRGRVRACAEGLGRAVELVLEALRTGELAPHVGVGQLGTSVSAAPKEV
jgi:adenosylhomocysteine nucleosidase